MAPVGPAGRREPNAVSLSKPLVVSLDRRQNHARLIAAADRNSGDELCLCLFWPTNAKHDQAITQRDVLHRLAVPGRSAGGAERGRSRRLCRGCAKAMRFRFRRSQGTPGLHERAQGRMVERMQSSRCQATRSGRRKKRPGPPPECRSCKQPGMCHRLQWQMPFGSVAAPPRVVCEIRLGLLPLSARGAPSDGPQCHAAMHARGTDVRTGPRAIAHWPDRERR